MGAHGQGITVDWQLVLRRLKNGWHIYSSNIGNVPQYWMVHPKQRRHKGFLDSRVIKSLKKRGLIESENLGPTTRHTLIQSELAPR